MNSLYADAVLPHRVSPFGYLRIEAYLQLPEAFRSLSRPSSAPDAKAFPLRSFLLDHRRACFVSFAAELAHRLIRSAALLLAPCPVASLPGPCRGFGLLHRFFRHTHNYSNKRVVQFFGSLSIRIMQTHLFYQQNCNYPFRRSMLRIVRR